MCNNIKAAGAEAFAVAIGQQLTQLRSLTIDVSHNNIKAAGAKALAVAIGQLTQLTSLTIDLSHNNIGDVGNSMINLLKSSVQKRSELVAYYNAIKNKYLTKNFRKEIPRAHIPELVFFEK